MFPGAAFGVLHKGRVAALASAGRFTYEPASTAVEAGTNYDLASVSKVAATTAMAMLLWQRGQLGLDLPLSALLPEFLTSSFENEDRRAMTLRMLLAHASGLPAHVPFYEHCKGRQQVLRAALAVPLVSRPGEQARYSDPGFILLGAALEKLAGETLDRFCEREVFAPLEMQRTRFGVPAGERNQVPPTEIDRVYRKLTVQGEVHDENCWAMGGVCGHAGLFAPAADLLRFSEAMLAPLRKGSGQTLFTAEAIRLFTRRAELPPGSSRALGWDTPSGSPSSSGTRMSAEAFGHLGYTGTSLWIDPAQDTAVVLLTNRTMPSRENKKIQELRPKFHDAVMKAVQNDTDGR